MTAAPPSIEITQLTVPAHTSAELRLQARDDARHSIAKWLVIAYVAVIAVNIGAPLVLYLTTRRGPVNIDDFKDLVLTLGTVTTGIAGILGFVMGYYFKSEADNQAGAKPRKAKAQPTN